MGTMNARQLYRASSIDAHPRLFANAFLYGDKAVNALPDIDRCDFLLVVGANPVVSTGSMLTLSGIGKRLKVLRDRGGRLVVVDPRRTETTDIADEHIALKPTSDARCFCDRQRPVRREFRRPRNSHDVAEGR